MHKLNIIILVQITVLRKSIEKLKKGAILLSVKTYAHK